MDEYISSWFPFRLSFILDVLHSVDPFLLTAWIGWLVDEYIFG